MTKETNPWLCNYGACCAEALLDAGAKPDKANKAAEEVARSS